MSEEKMSKKADARIYKFISAFQPTVSKNVTYDEVWQYLVDNCKLEGSLYTTDTRKERTTRFNLYIVESKEPEHLSLVHEFNWDNKDSFYPEKGDWNWTYIFKSIIDYIIDNKIIKKPRAKKSAIKTEKNSQIDKCKETKKSPVKSKKNKVKSKETK